jgi:hypothetical protein
MERPVPNALVRRNRGQPAPYKVSKLCNGSCASKSRPSQCLYPHSEQERISWQQAIDEDWSALQARHQVAVDLEHDDEHDSNGAGASSGVASSSSWSCVGFDMFSFDDATRWEDFIYFSRAKLDFLARLIGMSMKEHMCNKSRIR